MNILIFNPFGTKSIKIRVTCIDFQIRIQAGHGPVTCTRNLTFSPINIDGLIAIEYCIQLSMPWSSRFHCLLELMHHFKRDYVTCIDCYYDTDRKISLVGTSLYLKQRNHVITNLMLLRVQAHVNPTT